MKVLKYIGAGCGALILGAVLLLTTTKVVYPAISSLVGLAVAESATLWNNVRDGSAGDNLTNGLLMTSLGLWDGTNSDRAPADAYANPTTAVNTIALNSTFNATTWDRLKDLGNAGDASTTGAGIPSAGCMYFARSAAVYQRCGGVAGYLATVGMGQTQSPNGTVTTQTTGATNTAVAIAITGATNTRAHVNGVDAYCSAGTSGVTITTATGTTTIWSTPAAAVGATLFSKEFPTALTTTVLADTVTVTLASCGVGNTGTLMVRGGRGV